MTFTYASDNLTAGGTAQAAAVLRLALGDTVLSSGPLPGGVNFDDAEILYYVSNGGAAAAAGALARTWSRLVDTTAGPISKSYSQAATFWATEAVRLGGQAGGGYATFRTGIARQDGYAYRAGTVDVNP